MEKIRLEFFEDYHNNKLDREAVRKFEEELTVNQSLSDDYHEFLSIKEAAERHEYNRLKQKLKVKIEEHKNKSGQTKNWQSIIRPMYRYRYIAASVAILLIAFIPLYQNVVYPHLFSQRFELNESSGNKMSIKSNDDATTKSIRDSYYKGIEAIEQKNYEQAIKIFQSIKDNTDNTTYQPLALYNIALIEIKMEEKEKANATLQELVDLPYKNYLKSKAKTLQEQLYKPKIFFFF